MAGFRPYFRSRGGGFRVAVACFRFPTAVDARAVEAGCRRKARLRGGPGWTSRPGAAGEGRRAAPSSYGDPSVSGRREDAERKRREKGGRTLTVYHLGSPTAHLFKEQKKSLKGKGAGSDDTYPPPCLLEVELGGSGVQSQPQQHSKFQAGLGYVRRSGLKKKQNKPPND